MLGRILMNAGLAACILAGSLTAGVKAAEESVEKPKRPKMDLAFCIDTTGSMQGELDVVKNKMKELVAKLSSTKPVPDIRVGLVAFRDRGDDYVTKVFQFSEDIDKVVKDISNLQAGGGGDAPEAVNQALHTAITDLDWDASKKATKVLFLIGDAGPHAYPGDYNWKTECSKAIGRGIQINAIGCNGLEQFPSGLGIDVFKEIAKLTDGRFETLAYRQEVVSADGRRETLISSGGAVYKVKAADKDSWKAGAAALMAAGKAEKSAAAPTLARGRFASEARPMMMMSASPMAPAAAAYGGGSAGFARSDSNLDSILLNGARDAMAKKAH